MYKILIKYTSTFDTVFWKSYIVTQENGENVEFATYDIQELKKEINKLDKIYGYENIRVIKDVTYEILVNVNESGMEFATQDDINNIYTEAYNKIYNEEEVTE